MSRKPQAQRRQAIKDAKADKAYAQKRLAQEKSKEGRATFQRAIDRYNKTIEENKGK